MSEPISQKTATDPHPPMAHFGTGEPNEAPTLLEISKRPVAVPLALRSFGDYELLTEIARGGMGVVYRARHIKLNRVVALKMILAGNLANPDDVRRFQTEAEAAARLQHPNIVAIHEVGEVNGHHYFTMELIEGPSLTQRLAKGPLPGKTAAQLVRQVARAMDHAHKQGILHRDIKPSNILLDAQEEPHITDFGLAKRLDGDQNNKTRTGSVLGTPSYMAPEQASGKTHEIGPAVDIYGMGALLYELLTARPPFRAETPFDTIMQVMHSDPVPPRLLNPKIDADLETICLKCLEKEPRDRYHSAQELADDLQRYLDGVSISARSFNILDRLTRTLERSHHDFAFHTWSTMLFIMAFVIFAEHVLVFFLLQAGAARWQILAARSSQLILLGMLFYCNRGRRLMPTSAPERELWTIWIGYFLAYAATLLVTRLLPYFEVIQIGSEDHEILPYPFISILAGLAFFTMGSNYWGRCYTIGLAFFAMAVLMPLHPTWAPLEFGLLWSVALLDLGWHLRKLGQQAPPDKPA